MTARKNCSRTKTFGGLSFQELIFLCGYKIALCHRKNARQLLRPTVSGLTCSHFPRSFGSPEYPCKDQGRVQVELHNLRALPSTLLWPLLLVAESIHAKPSNGCQCSLVLERDNSSHDRLQYTSHLQLLPLFCCWAETPQCF